MTGRKSGMVNIHWPGLSSPRRTLVVRSWYDTRGDKSTVALSLVRSISPDSVSKRKAFGGVET